jgi:molecular chaperone DnaK
MTQLIGIDLGTTNSAVAFLDDLGKPHLLTLSDGDRLLPSAVFFHPNREKVDLSRDVGGHAKDMLEMYPERVAFGFKRVMDDTTQDFFRHGDVSVSSTQLSAMILKKLGRTVEHHLGEFPSAAVITVPATFPERAREATRRAAELAGISDVTFINEPTAAILYATSLPNHSLEGKVLVFDLGGGTFDATLAEVKDQEVTVVWSEGDHNLGGLDFDKAILELVASQDSQFEGVCIPNNYLLSEQIKKRLGRESEISHFLYKDNAASDRLPCTVTIADFERATAHLMTRVMQLVEIVLDNPLDPVTPSEVSAVLLVGGSTRMPMVTKAIEKMFGKPPIAVPNVDEAVALGAAINAGLIAKPGQLSSLQAAALARTAFSDVVSQYLGTFSLSEEGSVNTVIIEKGETIPVRREETFRLLFDGQERVNCELTQAGYPESDPDLVEILMEEKLELPEGAKRGDVIEVIYEVNESNEVFCRFTHVLSGAAQEFSHCFGTDNSDSPLGTDLGSFLTE